MKNLKVLALALTLFVSTTAGVISTQASNEPVYEEDLDLAEEDVSDDLDEAEVEDDSEDTYDYDEEGLEDADYDEEDLEDYSDDTLIGETPDGKKIFANEWITIEVEEYDDEDCFLVEREYISDEVIDDADIPFDDEDGENNDDIDFSDFDLDIDIIPHTEIITPYVPSESTPSNAPSDETVAKDIATIIEDVKNNPKDYDETIATDVNATPAEN